ncbi:MAG: M23 family metallopeptidase, partial [Schleiferiaceae bacterium]|nr:M23 family metallopeptidase [Schleiferiaceae bacterium]
RGNDNSFWVEHIFNNALKLFYFTPRKKFRARYLSLIMAVEKQKQKRVERWRNKFRLVILNDDTFEELLTLRLSPLNVFTFSVFAIVFTIATTSLVIAFTPLKELVPGYASSKIRRQAVELSLKTDSLEGVLRQNERYVSGVQRILRGEVIDSVVQDVLSDDTAAGTDIVLSNPSTTDSVFRDWVEDETVFSLERRAAELDIPQLVAPVEGVVTSSFDRTTGHFAVDIASTKNSPIKSCYDGTIVFADWTSENGHIIIVQHENNLVSAYKHNSALLKEVGDFIRSGEAIAIIGNSGENSTGPHLHFELWYEGRAINPEEYIKL